MNRKKTTWKWRSLISFYLLFAGLALLISGVVLFVAPSGRIAYTLDWHLLGLDKTQWEAIHTIFGYVTTAFAIAHLILNWRALLSYLRNRVRRTYRLRAELIAALILTLLVGTGAALNLPPFSNIMDLGEKAKTIWERQLTTTYEHEAEVTHEAEAPAELETTGTAVDEATPVIEAETEHEEGGYGVATAGWGRYTVGELCADEKIPVDEALARLAAHGLEAEASTRIRTLADTSSYEPSEVVDIILGAEIGTTGDHD